MQENEFEKQVREKMTELGFDPSDSVWARVDKEINPERKRRRPLFWLFFLSGILLAGAGYYMSDRNGVHQRPLNQMDKNMKNESTIAMREKKENRTGINNSGQSDANSMKTDAAGIKTVSFQNNPGSPKRETAIRHQPVTGKKHSGSSATMEQEESDAASTDAGHSSTDLTENQNQTHAGSLQDSTKTDLASVNNKTTDSSAITKTKTNPIPATSDSTSAKTAKSKKKSAWQMGLTAGAGASNVNQSLFKSASVPGNSYLSAATPAGGVGGGFYSSPEYHTGFSFGIGAFARKNFTARVFISGGMEYHYYSNKINTGNQLVNTTTLNPALLSAYNASAYYQSGSNKVYTNQYHFLQFPVAAGWQLNKNPKHPLTWEAGLSPSWLMASTALQFDPSTGILYKNNHSLNRFQVNAGTSVLIGIPGKRAAWQAGPEVQYGLTGLMNAASGSSQHLLYYGLKLNFIPVKK